MISHTYFGIVDQCGQMNQNEDDNFKNENFETFIVDRNLEHSEYIIYTIFELTINKDQKYL
jgi:hypothetical protein